MLKRFSLLAASTAALAACATDPAPVAGPSAGPAASTVPGPSIPAPLLNIAANSQWVSEERLMPLDPILALVGNSGSLNDQVGFSMTCNPDNGRITARLGKQPAARAGQNVIYRLRLGAEAQAIEGRIEAARMGGGEPEFVFDLPTATLRTMSRLDAVSVVTDTGEVQWAFVRDPSALPPAQYIAALRNFAVAAENWLVFCNPK